MRSGATLSAYVSSCHLAGGGDLRVSDLNRAERLVVCALRAAASRPRRAGIAVAEQERDELRDLSRIVERYLQSHPPAVVAFDATASETTLDALECHTLHALACLQAGLLGEAWKSLVPVWGAAEAGKALVRLQDVAAALQMRDRRVERWHFDPAFFREAALI